MKKIDHLALADYLVRMSNDEELKAHSLAFSLGSIAPDVNPFSYLMGMRSEKKFHGHNAENSAKHLKKCIFSLMAKGLNSSVSYFRLGIILHYIADSFTAVHNDFLDVSIRDHLAYENELHTVLLEKLRSNAVSVTALPYSPISYLLECQREYKAGKHSTDADSSYIIRTCALFLHCALRYRRSQSTELAYQAVSI